MSTDPMYTVKIYLTDGNLMNVSANEAGARRIVTTELHKKAHINLDMPNATARINTDHVTMIEVTPALPPKEDT